MAQESPSDRPADSGLENQLHSVAQLVREADYLGPEAQQALAEIVEELGKALRAVPFSSQETRLLAESTTHLVRALHQRQDRGFLTAASNRLKRAITGVENQAPFAAQIAGRLLDTLASLGI